MQIFEMVLEENNRYTLKQNNKFKKITLMFEFFGIDKPKEGYKIAISEKLLDKKNEVFSQPYSFELYLEYNEKKFIPVNDEEFIVLHNGKKNYIMKRIYG